MSNDVSLTTTHLRLICEATTPPRLETEDFRAEQNPKETFSLRGALGQVLTQAGWSG